MIVDAVLAKLFGTKTEREIKGMLPTVAAITEFEPAMRKLSDIDLAAKTTEFKEKLAQGAPFDDLLFELRSCDATDRDLHRKSAIRCAEGGGHSVRSGAVQKMSLIWAHMLRMPLSVKSRFRKRPAGVPFTLICGTWTYCG